MCVYTHHTLLTCMHTHDTLLTRMHTHDTLLTGTHMHAQKHVHIHRAHSHTHAYTYTQTCMHAHTHHTLLTRTHTIHILPAPAASAHILPQVLVLVPREGAALCPFPPVHGDPRCPGHGRALSLLLHHHLYHMASVGGLPAQDRQSRIPASQLAARVSCGATILPGTLCIARTTSVRWQI